jgi:hypothetical protein
MSDALSDLIDKGWMRQRPYAVFFILSWLVMDGTSSYSELVASSNGRDLGEPDADCWADLDEGARRTRYLRAESARFAKHFGLAGVETYGQVVDLLVACGAIQRDGDRLTIMTPIHRVDELLPVSNSERVALEAMQDRHHQSRESAE